MKLFKGYGLAALCGAVALAGCEKSMSPTYTLYRESSVPNDGRITRVHMATFDAVDSGEYNRENCFTARDLFQGQSNVTVRYWCELGKFKP